MKGKYSLQFEPNISELGLSHNSLKLAAGSAQVDNSTRIFVGMELEAITNATCSVHPAAPKGAT